MEQAFGKYLMFRNRLEKVYRHVGKLARKQQVSCYRVYDHDLPEFPFIIERYGDKAYVAEYRRRHGMSGDEHQAWIEECSRIISGVLEIDPSNLFFKLRQRKEGRQGQYQKLQEEKNEFIVEENGLSFIVNLSDYLDTGLFLDHRITRQMCREMSADKNVLNLFCYTGSFSVYAVAGKACRVVSVDLSRTYLNWTERNMKLNFPLFIAHETIQADVKQYLKKPDPVSFDLIVMDPPTFSNSKRMDDFLDIQRDHVELINDCIRLLSPGGVLIFSTNFTRFRLESEKLNSNQVRDITRQTTPFDFTGKLKRQCFLVRREDD
jgi:23S rRNA (cytosine1962-C5)-methyltransferase